MTEPRSGNRRSRFGSGWRADRRWQAGFLLGSAIGAAATASALAELLSINALEAPAGTATHLQLTTGDVGAFRSIAERMFGEAFPDVAGVEIAAVAR